MDQIVEFVGNHWLLALGFVAVLVAIIVNELVRLKSGTSSLDPSAATQLYNRQDALFVDTRGDADFRKAHLPGAIHLPASAISERAGRLDRFKDKPIIVYCANGMQSGRVVAELKKLGFAQIYQLRGGLASWQAAGYPLEGK
jgi:rhodanese-related sulfurtransferase